YQHLVDQLLTLQEVLDQVACIDPPEGLRITANVIKGSKGPVGNARKIERKLHWGASNKTRDVQKLQQELAGYVGSINIAIGIYNVKVNALEVKQAQEQRAQIEDGVHRTNQGLQTVQEIMEVQNRSLMTLISQLGGLSNMSCRILYV
ncbi:MAG: hypothetical protein LQ347_002971, partial [Umbilicaria vellea]